MDTIAHRKLQQYARQVTIVLKLKLYRRFNAQQELLMQTQDRTNVKIASLVSIVLSSL